MKGRKFNQREDVQKELLNLAQICEKLEKKYNITLFRKPLCSARYWNSFYKKLSSEKKWEKRKKRYTIFNIIEARKESYRIVESLVEAGVFSLSDPQCGKKIEKRRQEIENNIISITTQCKPKSEAIQRELEALKNLVKQLDYQASQATMTSFRL